MRLFPKCVFKIDVAQIISALVPLLLYFLER